MVVATDVGVGAGALQQLAQGVALLQHVAGGVPALPHRIEGQMAQHQAQPGRLRRRAAQLALGPGHLLGRHGGGGGIPHQQEQVVLAHAVGEGEPAGIHEGQPQRVLLPAPVALRLLPVELKRVTPAGAGGGGIVVAHGDRHRQPRPLQRRQQLAVEGGPHGTQVHAAEPLLLAGHHVAAAEHQVGFPAGNQLDSPQHLRQVARGAIAAVEVADGHQPQVAPRWQCGCPDPVGAGCSRP